jgi:ribosomal protein S27E
MSEADWKAIVLRLLECWDTEEGTWHRYSWARYGITDVEAKAIIQAYNEAHPPKEPKKVQVCVRGKFYEFVAPCEHPQMVARPFYPPEVEVTCEKCGTRTIIPLSEEKTGFR